MDFSLSSEHEILRESVRSFAENEIQPVAREPDEKEEFSYDPLRKMAELGLFGVFVSEAYGGQAMDYLSYIIAVEEIARVDGSHAATVAAENSLGIGPLYYFDSARINLGLFQHDVSVVWDLAPHDLAIMDYVIRDKAEAVVATGGSLSFLAIASPRFGLGSGHHQDRTGTDTEMAQ